MNALQTHGFGALLRRFRLASGMTQETLAERAGLSVRGISDLERGISSEPRLETLRLLVEALDLSEEDRAVFVHSARVQEPAARRESVARPQGELIGRTGV